VFGCKEEGKTAKNAKLVRIPPALLAAGEHLEGSWKGKGAEAPRKTLGKLLENKLLLTEIFSQKLWQKS
jgi:hypothetical protein